LHYHTTHTVVCLFLHHLITHRSLCFLALSHHAHCSLSFLALSHHAQKSVLHARYFSIDLQHRYMVYTNPPEIKMTHIHTSTPPSPHTISALPSPPLPSSPHHTDTNTYVGMARTIHIYVYTMYIRYFGREITIHTVIYGVYTRFWPTLHIRTSPPTTALVARAAAAADIRCTHTNATQKQELTCTSAHMHIHT